MQKIPLSEVQYAMDETSGYLEEMRQEGKFGQWASYLLESIEDRSGEEALGEIYAILHTRFSHGRW